MVDVIWNHGEGITSESFTMHNPVPLFQKHETKCFGDDEFMSKK